MFFWRDNTNLCWVKGIWWFIISSVPLWSRPLTPSPIILDIFHSWFSLCSCIDTWLYILKIRHFHYNYCFIWWFRFPKTNFKSLPTYGKSPWKSVVLNDPPPYPTPPLLDDVHFWTVFFKTLRFSIGMYTTWDPPSIMF